MTPLLRLRLLFTLLLPFSIYTFAHTYHRLGGNLAHFHVLYALITVLLLGCVCLSAWLGRWTSFLLLAIMDRSISAYGSLLYLLDMTLPSTAYHSLQKPGPITWNLLSFALSFAIVVHLSRRYPPDIRSLSRPLPFPRVLRFLQMGLLVLTVVVALDLAPTFLRHLQQTGVHSHSCSHVLADSGLLLAMLWMGIAGLRNQWRMFVSFGVITQSVMVFRVLAGLVSDSLSSDPSGAMYTPPELFRDLSVLAFTVFSCVYLARSFPRVVQLGDATPPPNPFP